MLLLLLLPAHTARPTRSQSPSHRLSTPVPPTHTARPTGAQSPSHPLTQPVPPAHTARPTGSQSPSHPPTQPVPPAHRARPTGAQSPSHRRTEPVPPAHRARPTRSQSPSHRRTQPVPPAHTARPTRSHSPSHRRTQPVPPAHRARPTGAQSPSHRRTEPVPPAHRARPTHSQSPSHRRTEPVPPAHTARPTGAQSPSHPLTEPVPPAHRARPTGAQSPSHPLTEPVPPAHRARPTGAQSPPRYNPRPSPARPLVAQGAGMWVAAPAGQLQVDKAEEPVSGDMGRAELNLADDEQLLLAAAYVSDAQYNRNIQFETSPQAVRFYKLYNHWSTQGITYFFILVDLFLGLFEEPAVYLLPLWVTSTIEFICLAMFSVRLLHFSKVTPTKVFWKDAKNICVIVTILLTLLDMIVYLALAQNGYPAVRWSRVLRPLFCVNFTESRQLRRAFRNIRNSLPEIAYVFVLFMFSVAVFSLMALKLFAKR
ncbi:uncharacterized protein LOC129693743 [Leucoraja erinacea]|uniref:uncharacterized protein LOC129693743 n=1 Tax=Leucoraja erinaceus TaxID=7782 RepID=UPI002458FFCF|nr:uncharacterized protein LOC129693743 [Leucoraja erinacea]